MVFCDAYYGVRCVLWRSVVWVMVNLYSIYNELICVPEIFKRYLFSTHNSFYDKINSIHFVKREHSKSFKVLNYSICSLNNFVIKYAKLHMQIVRLPRDGNFFKVLIILNNKDTFFMVEIVAIKTRAK